MLMLIFRHIRIEKKSYSKYNALLYLFIQTCYLNKLPLLGGITLFYKKKYFCNLVHKTQF